MDDSLNKQEYSFRKGEWMAIAMAGDRQSIYTHRFLVAHGIRTLTMFEYVWIPVQKLLENLPLALPGTTLIIKLRTLGHF